MTSCHVPWRVVLTQSLFSSFFNHFAAIVATDHRVVAAKPRRWCYITAHGFDRYQHLRHSYWPLRDRRHAGKIIGVEIGDADENETRYRLQSRFSDTEALNPPTYVSEAIDKVRVLLDGGDPDFSQTPLALDSVPDLNRQVYEILLELKAGETITYGAIARRLGDVSLSQAVGYALGKNPFPIIVPCHRVLGSNGKVGGFSAAGGTATKLRLLNIERARTSLEPDLFGGLPLQARPEAE